MQINRERLLKSFVDLTAIDSPSLGERAMADALTRRLLALGFDVKEDDAGGRIGGNSGNLFAVLRGGDSLPPLLFCAHMDTVQPAQHKRAIMESDGTIHAAGDTVLGADDVSAISAILEAVQSTQEQGALRRDIEILFTVSEETYGTGAAVFDASVIRSGEAYVPDFDGVHGQVVIAAPTILTFCAEIEGKASHAGFAPEQGISAILAAARAIDGLKSGRISPDLTLNIGKIQGGLLTNIVPEACTVEGEIRGGEHAAALDCLRLTERAFQRACDEFGARLNFSSKCLVTAYHTPEDAPVVARYVRACEAYGIKAEAVRTFGGSDNKRNAIVIPYGTKSEYYTSRSISDKRFFKPRSEDAGPEPLFYEESLDQDAPVFVVESAFCALSIMQEGCSAVATCGTGTRKLIDALKAREIVPPVIVCMDRDSAGDEAAAKLCTQLKAQGVTHLRAATPEGYKDPNELLLGDPELFRSWVQTNVTQAEKLPTLTRRNVNQDIADTEALRALQPESNPRYLSTDIGNSRLYSDYYSSVVRYVPERKLWYIFSGKRWEPDIGGLKAMELCKKLANALMVYAFNISDEQQRKDYIDRCKKWQARRTRETILKDAQGVYPIPMDAFDRDPFLFNCQNGTIHLKDMSFQPHAPEDKITKISDVVYDPDARCERFDRFVDEIMSGDKDRARFLQRSLGYALSGDTRFECLFILYGATTRNGKGTLMESVLKVMGEYGSTVRPETISMKQNASSQNPTEDIARLAGIRFANISEPSRGLLLNAAQVKSMTGNDTLNARFLHENSFDFQPQFKIYMNTNWEHAKIKDNLLRWKERNKGPEIGGRKWDRSGRNTTKTSGRMRSSYRVQAQRL